VVPDNTTDYFCFEPGPVAVVNSTNTSIVIALQCHAKVSRLLLLIYDLQKKTYEQSPWAFNNGVYYYIYYDSHRQHLFGLRDASASSYIMEEYNTNTLEVIQVYTQHNQSRYGWACETCSVFDPDENWLIDIRLVSKGQYYHAYYMRMDLNLVGQKQDIVTKFQELSELGGPYTMTYDMKRKLILLTWERGTIITETIMFHLDPYTTKIQNETPLLKTPFGWVVRSVQALFNKATRQVLYLIKQTDLQQIQIIVWSIVADFDTLKIIEKKQVDTLMSLQDWTFFENEN
jgi:hypothetical protein